MKDIPMSRPAIGPLEGGYVQAALDGSWVSGSGPHIEEFEQRWAQRCGTAHAVAVSSGTAALHLLLLGLGVGPGEEVIVPGLTYAAVANAVRHAGGVPVVVDVDLETWCLAPDAVEQALTKRTVGVLAVHAYGHPADIDPLAAIAARHGVWLVEDAAEAHLATYRGRVVGGLAVAAAFSFFGNKIVSTGEGGAVATDDAELAARVRALSRQGVTGADDRYAPSLTGLGLRMGNLAAAVGCAQIERVGELLDRRRRVWRLYTDRLCETTTVSLQPIQPWACVAPWLYSVIVEGGPDGRRAMRDRLAAAGIASRDLFPNLARLPVAAPARHACPHTEALASCGVSLPLYPEMTEADVDAVVRQVCAS